MDTLTEAARRRAVMEREMSAQVDWLARRAKARGFANLDDLLGKAPAVFMQLAARWRQTQSLPETA